MKRKKWEELTLSDNFIFLKVMQDENLCKRVLSEILNIEISKIVYSSYEKVIDADYEAKGIRMDVYVRDEEGTVYNIEIQQADTYNLPKRSRYYQSLIDVDLIEKGQSYKSLNKSIVIFVCTFDLFGYGQYIYEFNNCCKQVPELHLEDGSTKLFLNSQGTKGNVSDGVKMFLKAINGIFTSDEFSVILKSAMDRVKQSKKWREEYMTLDLMKQDAYDEGFEEGCEDGRRVGLKEGREEGIKEGIKEGRKAEQCVAIKRMLSKLSTEEIIEMGYDADVVNEIAHRES